MLTAWDSATARRFKERLAEAGVPVERLLVYGSRARGAPAPDSDMDIFLVLSSVAPEVRALVGRAAWDVGFERGVVITTVEYTSDQLEDSPLRASPFVRAVQAEGVAI
ncbi:MAG: nucleotidyltransferase domain-containing protein [Deltaproteobacteria bacterium]|nr:nucleotidyltransferase domain-containing protein [Deltaproteobacteria bacterium]